VRHEAFDYYFVEEKGKMKLFYVDILPISHCSRSLCAASPVGPILILARPSLKAVKKLLRADVRSDASSRA
jgi:hypothetical protein